jgi:hypothetical protein
MNKAVPTNRAFLAIAVTLVTFVSLAFSPANTTAISIDLLSFEAHMNGTHVDIQWVTAYERNSDHYVVERSLDGRDFEEVIRVDGAGKSNMIIKYFDVDATPIEGVSYYRLKQATTNGQFVYSGTVPVDFDESGIPGMGIFSNSVNDEAAAVHVQSLVNEEVLVIVRNGAGDEDYAKVLINKIDGEVTGIDTDGHLAKGTYLITGSSENVLYSRQLMIE